MWTPKFFNKVGIKKCGSFSVSARGDLDRDVQSENAYAMFDKGYYRLLEIKQKVQC